MAEALRTGPARPAWPFMSAPSHHDHQVSEQGVGVPARQEIQFKDGSAIWLRRVVLSGTPDLFLRDLGDPLEGTRIDLRELIADVEKELPTTSTRDVAGYVSISLRLKFPTVDAFVAAIGREGAA